MPFRPSLRGLPFAVIGAVAVLVPLVTATAAEAIPLRAGTVVFQANDRTWNQTQDESSVSFGRVVNVDPEDGFTVTRKRATMQITGGRLDAPRYRSGRVNTTGGGLGTSWLTPSGDDWFTFRSVRLVLRRNGSGTLTAIPNERGARRITLATLDVNARRGRRTRNRVRLANIQMVLTDAGAEKLNEDLRESREADPGTEYFEAGMVVGKLTVNARTR